jgi:hypothetical protein
MMSYYCFKMAVKCVCKAKSSEKLASFFLCRKFVSLFCKHIFCFFSILELVQSNPGIFSEGVRLYGSSGQQPPPTPGRTRRPSNESIVSGMFDTQQMHAMAVMKASREYFTIILSTQLESLCLDEIQYRYVEINVSYRIQGNYTLYQGCGSGLIYYGSGSSIFAQSGSGSS